MPKFRHHHGLITFTLKLISEDNRLLIKQLL